MEVRDAGRRIRSGVARNDGCMASDVADEGGAPMRAPEPLAIPIALLGAIAVLAAVRMYVSANAGLTDDEAYYRLWSLAPSLSYLDHPPMVAWLIAGGRQFAGDWPFGIRFGAGISALIVLAAVWRTAALLFSDSVARNSLWLVWRIST